jgi:tetratricopeptide (TPR) repeat protein
VKRTGFLFLLILLFLLCGGLYAQTQQDWWYTLERGKQMFRQRDYGSALLAFEDARRQRRAMYERMEREFVELLSITEVRRLGDSLDLVERFAEERRYAAALEALRELYYRVPRESFNNSATAALNALAALSDYPEAEYWIGETYLAEGELGLALSQFQKALGMRNLFENPGYATELLYKIAEIRRVRQEYTEMERVFLSLLSADTLWSSDGQNNANQTGNSSPFVKQAMTRTLENNGIDRFMTLYRYGNGESAQAHRFLGFYYYGSGRHARAQEHLMFAFLIQNTVIIDEVIRRRFDFSFTTLEALAAEINSNSLLGEYVERNEYYKTAFYLGNSLYGNGKTAAARSVWSFLATQSRAGEWQTRAQAQLRSPSVEPAVETL